MKRILAILDRTPLWAIMVAYVVVGAVVLVLSIVVFFFPILPICALLDKEFSNLGPIATFVWGLLVDILVLTPVFLIVLSAKIARVVFLRLAQRKERQ